MPRLGMLRFWGRGWRGRTRSVRRIGRKADSCSAAARRARHKDVPSSIPPSPPEMKNAPPRHVALLGERVAWTNPLGSTNRQESRFVQRSCPKGEAQGGAEQHPTLSARNEKCPA